MRHPDFNEKYSEYINGEGLDTTLSYEAMKLLDKLFEEYRKCHPIFKISRIGYKDGKGYANIYGLPVVELWTIEQILTNDLKQEYVNSPPRGEVQ